MFITTGNPDRRNSSILQPMNKLLLTFTCFVFLACNNAAENNNAESDLDAARMFIRNSLDGKYDAARQLMIRDTVNNDWMDDFERKYERIPQSDKRGYRESSITIHDTRSVNDSASIVVYSNTFSKRK